jgi:hypothetical protein
MKFVREASQRRSASHTHKHDPDTHGDQTRSLIIQPEHGGTRPGIVLPTPAHLVTASPLPALSPPSSSLFAQIPTLLCSRNYGLESLGDAGPEMLHELKSRIQPKIESPRIIIF